MHPDLSIPGLCTALTAVCAPRQDFSVMREEAAPCTESSSKFRLQQRKDLRYEVVWELTTRLEDDNQQREMFTKKGGKMKQDQLKN